MTSQPFAGRWLLIAAIVVVGLNLRGPIVAISPVLDDIRDDLHVSGGPAGLLTSVPVFCFAAVSPLVAVVARRIGADITIAISMVVLAIGVAVRPWSGFALMLAGTVLVGAAIAVGNVLLPVIIRRDFASRSGPIMSAMSTSLLFSATIPAVLTVPLASLLGWRAALSGWAVLAVVALAMWWTATRSPDHLAVVAEADDRDRAASAKADHQGGTSVWSRRAAWELGIFYGLQSLLFFALTAWMPTMLQDGGGLDAATAGTALSIFQFLGLGGAAAVPVLIRRRQLRNVLAAGLGVLWVLCVAGLLLQPGAWPVWCVLGGVAQGGCLAMGLSLIAVRSTSSDAARRISAMVQTVAYTIGGIGPVLIGAMSVAVDGWTAPFAILIALSVACGIFGVRAAAPPAIM